MMKAKRFLMIMTLLLMVAGVNAQKIDQRLTRLVEKNNTRSAQNQITLNPEAVKQQIAVAFNADGTSRIKRTIVFKEHGEGIKGHIYENEAEIKAQTTDDTTTSHGTHISMPQTIRTSRSS